MVVLQLASLFSLFIALLVYRALVKCLSPWKDFLGVVISIVYWIVVFLAIISMWF